MEEKGREEGGVRFGAEIAPYRILQGREWDWGAGIAEGERSGSRYFTSNGDGLLRSRYLVHVS